MKAAGLKEGTDFRVVNEYDPKQAAKHTTGGHIHVEIRNKEAAAKYAQFTSDSMEDAKSKEPVGLIPQDSKLQRSNDAARRSGNASYVPSTVGNNSTNAVINPNLRTLNLSAQDIEDLTKVVETEVVKFSDNKPFEEQSNAIVDTILNRVMSGRWGNSVRDVANAKSQFTKINGPAGYKDKQGKWHNNNPYGSVQNMPNSKVSQRVREQVLKHLKDREQGLKSVVGSHLNYLNPNHSDKKNLNAWGYDLMKEARSEGLVFGTNKSIHGHGTTKDLIKHKPAPFNVNLESNTPNKALNSNTVPRQLKLMEVKPIAVVSERSKVATESVKKVVEKAVIEPTININAAKPMGVNSQSKIGSHIANSSLSDINENIAHMPARQVSQKVIAYAVAGGTNG